MQSIGLYLLRHMGLSPPLQLKWAAPLTSLARPPMAQNPWAAPCEMSRAFPISAALCRRRQPCGMAPCDQAGRQTYNRADPVPAPNPVAQPEAAPHPIADLPLLPLVAG